MITGCLSAKGDVSIDPDREKYLVSRQSSKLFMVLNSGNFCQMIFFRFFYLTQPLQPQTEMVYNLCKKYGFLSINSTKNGCFVSRNKKDIILNAFLEEKRDSSLLRPQRLLRL